MSNFERKPKRKGIPNNRYLPLVVAFVFGILLTAFAGALFFYVNDNSGVPTPVPLPATIIPSSTGGQSISAQGIDIQPTVVANRVQAVAISSDGNYLAYSSPQTGLALRILNANDALTGATVTLHQTGSAFDDLAFSTNSRYLVASMNNGSALLFDVVSQTPIEEYVGIGGAAFTADSEKLVLVGVNTGIRILDVTGAQPTLIRNQLSDDNDYQVGAVAINGRNVLAIALDGRIELYNLDDFPASQRILNVSDGFVHDLAFDPTGDFLAVAVTNAQEQVGTVRVFDLESASGGQTTYDFGARVFTVAFSQGGDWLVAAGGESGYGEARMTAFRWDDGNPIPPDPAFYQPLFFTGHNHTIFDVGFTPAGYVLSASWDGSIRLWNLDGGNEVAQIMPE